MDSENDKTIQMPGLAKPQDKKPKAKAKSAKKPVKKAAKAKKAMKKARKKAVKRSKTVKTKRKPGKSKGRATVERCERLDLRLTKAEKMKVRVKAKKLRRTVTSIVIEAIEKIR